MIECGNLTQSSAFKDCKTGLVVFGILQIILLGGTSALSMFSIMIDVIVPLIPDNSSTPHPMNATLVIFSFLNGYF